MIADPGLDVKTPIWFDDQKPIETDGAANVSTHRDTDAANL